MQGLNVTIFTSIFSFFFFRYIIFTVRFVQSTNWIKLFDMGLFTRDYPKHLIYKPVGLSQKRNTVCLYNMLLFKALCK